jgi:DNA-directed RNA polymerase delta subunit
MYEFGEIPSEEEKIAATNNIITIVRASQENKLFIDYDGMINDITKKFGVNHPEVKELTALLYTLRDTNPYK